MATNQNLTVEVAIQFPGLSSNSKCNTTGPDGLRCCYANEMLHTLECGRS